MIKVKVFDSDAVKVSVCEETTLHLGVNPTEVIIAGRMDEYDGDYDVIPKDYPITLETKDKTMTDDVTIRKVTFFKTSNPSGFGDTVYIGG